MPAKRSQQSTQTDRLVLPGGIEAHCHIDEPPMGGAILADDFASGSIAAACGGTTTMIPFATQVPGQTLRAAVDDYHARADGKSVIDYSFHMIVSDPNDQVLGQELPSLLHDGYTSFKVFMTYDDFCLDDGQILEVMATAKRHGGFVMVHAENDHCIRWLAEQLESAGKTEPASFSIAHGPVAEREATHRAISLAEIVDTPVFIVHVSSAQAMETDRLGPISWPARLCGDLPAIPLPQPGRLQTRRLGGCQIPLRTATKRPRQSRSAMAWPEERHLPAGFVGSLSLQHEWPGRPH